MTPDLLPQRLSRKIAIDERGCWIWTAAIASNGYGSVGWHGRVRSSHRVVYEMLVGPVPQGMQTDHLCRVRACCNPAHLEVVTAGENLRRSRALITHCPQGHEYTPENTIWNHGTRRNCRECSRAYKRAYDHRQRAKAKAA